MVGTTVHISRSVTPEAMATNRAHGDSRSRSGAGHMDRRRVCDRWTRFHATPQTAEVSSVQSIVTRVAFGGASAALRGWLLNGR